MLIAQLSDIHVRPKGMLYKDLVDSNALFSQALASIEGLDTRPDLVIISGDLVDYGLPEEYARLRELLAPLSLPLFLMPGNHDSRLSLLASFPEHAYLPRAGAMHYVVDTYPVRLIALDTSVPGKHHGALDRRGLDWLEHTLKAEPEKPTLVFMHHPPFASGIPYLDEYSLLDPKPLENVLREFNNVEAVLFGHVHRPMFKRWAGTVAAACPSTATQIALQLQAGAMPKSYEGPGALLLHYWTPEAGLVSHTSYTGKYEGPFDFF